MAAYTAVGQSAHMTRPPKDVMQYTHPLGYFEARAVMLGAISTPQKTQLPDARPRFTSIPRIP